MNLNCARTLYWGTRASLEAAIFQIIMANWPVEHGVFCVLTFFERKSVVKVQRAFRVHFQIARHGSIPTRNTILKWVEQFNATGKVTDQFVGTQRTHRGPRT
jgi:hypothetical protein